MFFTELTPIFQKIGQQPIAFLGGFCSGVLRLNPNEDPLKSWLDNQTDSVPKAPENARPQKIEID